ncbi:Phytosulfokines 3 [Glycine soja]
MGCSHHQEQRCVTVLVQDGIYVNFQGVSGLLETFQFMQQLQGRLGPASSSITSIKTQHGVLEEEKLDVEETCDGIGEEECLMRRTLVAHTDYIYTQKHKP